MIYYGSQGNILYIIDMDTGDEILSTKSRYGSYHYAFTKEFQKFESVPPAIDAEEGVFYMPDRFRMFCFKLWEK